MKAEKPSSRSTVHANKKGSHRPGSRAVHGGMVKLGEGSFGAVYTVDDFRGLVEFLKGLQELVTSDSSTRTLGSVSVSVDYFTEDYFIDDDPSGGAFYDNVELTSEQLNILYAQSDVLAFKYHDKTLLENDKLDEARSVSDPNERLRILYEAARIQRSKVNRDVRNIRLILRAIYGLDKTKRTSILSSALFGKAPGSMVGRSIDESIYVYNLRVTVRLIEITEILRESRIDGTAVNDVKTREFQIDLPVSRKFTGTLETFDIFNESVSQPFKDPYPMLTLDELFNAYGSVYSMVSVMHEAGWSHLDIKTENIFYVEAPEGGKQFALGDFGLCIKSDTSLSDAGTNMFIPIDFLINCCPFVHDTYWVYTRSIFQILISSLIMNPGRYTTDPFRLDMCKLKKGMITTREQCDTYVIETYGSIKGFHNFRDFYALGLTVLLLIPVGVIQDAMSPKLNPARHPELKLYRRMIEVAMMQMGIITDIVETPAFNQRRTGWRGGSSSMTTKWVLTKRKTTMPDGSERALYKHSETGELRIRKMVQGKGTCTRIARYVKVNLR